MMEELLVDPEVARLRHIEPSNHDCPVCSGNLYYSGKHNAFVCVLCATVFPMEDIFLYEQEVI